MGLQEDLAQVALQERALQFPRFDEVMAWELGKQVRALAVERDLPVVIDVRRFGQPLFYTALAGTTPDNVEWVRKKINVVARFHRSSYGVGLNLAAKNGRFLSPFARVLLAIAYAREQEKPLARDLLVGLKREFPHNPLFKREIARLDGEMVADER